MIMDGYEFQSTRPLRGGTSVLTGPSLNRLISIHPPLAGRDEDELYHSCKRDISIHPPLAGRDKGLLVTLRFADISIHPPLAGRDTARDIKGDLLYISIHPPLAGRDPGQPSPAGKPGHFNPPAPCGAGRERIAVIEDGQDISIHPPLAGRDNPFYGSYASNFISIHPPLAGRDGQSGDRPPPEHFNPPAPCGAGPRIYPPTTKTGNFNPPAPCGAGRISGRRTPGAMHFNPPAPCGAGLAGKPQPAPEPSISIHPPLAGRDFLEHTRA